MTSRRIRRCFLGLLALVVGGCGLGPTSAPTPTGASLGLVTPRASPATNTTPRQVPSAVLQVEQDVLTGMATYGLDTVPGLNGGLGQLWINWRPQSNPLTTNWNNTPAPECTVTSGTPQCVAYPPRTDRLTDLRYLHNLALYRQQQPQDRRFDAQYNRWLAIVKRLWARPRDPRGWTYELLVDISRLTGDPFFASVAADQARYYHTSVFHSACRCLYFVDSQHPNGYYRPVDTIEEAAALAEEGARSGNQTYIQEARDALRFILDHGYLRTWHAFPFAWDNVLRPDGSVNDNPTFAKGLANPGPEVRVIWLAQEAQTLLHATRATSDPSFAKLATEMLDALTPEVNTLGLWDSVHGGYCEKVTFTGSSLAAPGQPVLGCSKKEAGRQLVVLDAVHVASTLGLGTGYADLERRMTALAVGPDYDAAGHGYVYEVARDYRPYNNHGIPEDWVTSEANGIALEALFSLGDPTPW